MRLSCYLSTPSADACGCAAVGPHAGARVHVGRRCDYACWRRAEGGQALALLCLCHPGRRDAGAGGRVALRCTSKRARHALCHIGARLCLRSSSRSALPCTCAGGVRGPSPACAAAGQRGGDCRALHAVDSDHGHAARRRAAQHRVDDQVSDGGREGIPPRPAWGACALVLRASHSCSPCPVTRRLPREVPLRLVGVGMALPSATDAVDGYLVRLKDAGEMQGRAAPMCACVPGCSRAWQCTPLHTVAAPLSRPQRCTCGRCRCGSTRTPRAQ